MLKAPAHQVAGHKAGNGVLGPLVDGSGRFYKPLQDGTRGSKEMAFYDAFSSDTRIPDHIRKFFPAYYGTQVLEASDGSGLHQHLVLQDFVSNCSNPSLIDVKIGSRTWYPEASEDYIKKCMKKDLESTSCWLGFRLSGLQVYQNEDSGFWKPAKKEVKGFSVEDIWSVLKKFVSSNPSDGAHDEPDCSLAHGVYGGSGGVLSQLLELKAWFEDQTLYHFYSCSVLIIFEKKSLLEGKNACAEVKLVDFAHVVDGNGVIDHNFLGGLCSFIKFVSETLKASDKSHLSNS